MCSEPEEWHTRSVKAVDEDSDETEVFRRQFGEERLLQSIREN
jgi:hypothetical protein